MFSLVSLTFLYRIVMTIKEFADFTWMKSTFFFPNIFNSQIFIFYPGTYPLLTRKKAYVLVQEFFWWRSITKKNIKKERDYCVSLRCIIEWNRVVFSTLNWRHSAFFFSLIFLYIYLLMLPSKAQNILIFNRFVQNEIQCDHY